jgi:FkbM family methyltransferase
MRSLLRRLADRFPAASSLYREVRDTLHGRRAPALETPFGFRLAGNPLMASGAFEPEETRLLLEELTSAELFVDVGANIGLYSCLAAARGLNVLALEPLPQNLVLLFRNLRENGFDRAEVLPLGLGERPGIQTLYGGGTGASLIRGWAGAPAGWERSIALSTFDLLVAPRAAGRRTLIKLDIEGAELAALRGATRLLAQEPAPVWLVENNLEAHHPSGRNPHFRALFDLFFAASYRAFVADRERRELTCELVAAREQQGGAPAHNYLFRRG